MVRHHPQVRFHVDPAQMTANVTTDFAKMDDSNLGQPIDDPVLRSTVRTTLPSLEEHAQQLLDQYWSKPLLTNDPSHQLDVLIRVVDAHWCPRHPELKGVQGGYDATPTPKILLLCAVPDPELLTARFVHEFGHYLDWTLSISQANAYMAGFLQAEMTAEQMVAEHLGRQALTHDRRCSPSARADIRRLLAAEHDLEDQAAQDASFDFFQVGEGETADDRRARVLEAYALADEIVRLGRWTVRDLLRMNEVAVREALLSIPELWTASGTRNTA